MKIKLHYILAVGNLCLVSLLSPGSAYAQDNTFPALDAATYDNEAEKEREKVIYSTSSSTSSSELEPQAIHKLQTQATKDSIARASVHRTNKTTTENAKNAAKPSHGDDSILGFNFLYYLFEKYKLQDIVD